MLFALYRLRNEPDVVVFDVDLVNSPRGNREAWDCCGVYRVDDDSAYFAKPVYEPCHILGVVDKWAVTARQVAGDDSAR